MEKCSTDMPFNYNDTEVVFLIQNFYKAHMYTVQYRPLRIYFWSFYLLYRLKADAINCHYGHRICEDEYWNATVLIAGNHDEQCR